MPTSANELGAAPSPRGLSRLRRNNNQANASSTSLGSNQSSGGNESADGAAMRGSMDGLVDKVKSRAKRSVDGRRGSDESTSSNRLSTLFDRKRKDSKPKNSSPIRNRTFSVQSGDSGELALPGNQSDVSLANGSGNSSLLTDDYSENEAKPTRPTISPHQSHLGYLTLSSPQLNAQAGPEPSQLDSAIQEPTPAPASQVSRVPSIVEPAATDSLPVNGIPDRAPSPGSKLRTAFALNRKKSAGDADSIKSGAGGGSGGLGGLFRPRSRRNSVDVQESSAVGNTPESVQEVVKEAVAPVTAPQIQTSEERPQTPKERQRGRVNTNPIPSTPPGSRPETPTTLVTPPTPTDPSTRFPRAPTSAAKQSPTRPLSSVESIKHRRAQSANLPSKLSNATAAPLTPFPEETKTPGGTLTQPIGATGFFTSVFSAAQKAADQLSSSINTSAASNQKKATPEAAPGSDKAIAGNESKSEVETKQTLDTLGSGNLSLSHLGIAESNDISPMNSISDLSGQQDGNGNISQTNKAEEEAAARAVSVAYEKPVAATISQAMGAQPASIASQDRPLPGEQSPTRSAADTDTIIKRSGSVRSKLSGRRRRHRGSSATTATANTIGTALRDSVTGLANVQSNAPGHRLTGFAVASSKRNKDFHQLFRSVPEDDYLIEDYSAALQRDILLHGRLYVSEGHICFSSNIFGWVTNLVISFDEVVSVEKKNTAVVFPNAIVISTLNARNTFASFVTRDSTYELLIGIWKISHPNLKSTLNGVAVDKNNIAASDKTEKAESIGSEDDSDDGSDDEVYDEDDDDDDIDSFTEADAGRSIAGSDYGENTLSRKTSAQPVAALANGAVPKGLESSDTAVVGAAVGADFPGVPTHAPTECSDTAEHYDRPLTDTIIPAPLGKIYSLMFGPGSSVFMKKWLVDDQKSRELDYADDKFGLDNDHKSFTFSYIKPLSGAVGPKQTKCITTNTLESFDLEKAITVNCSTQTPDVPSGNVFTTKTKYCLMWGPNNSTRMIANCTIEWTGKSWLKGPIESGAQSGQTAYITAILASLKAAVVSKPPVRGAPTTGGKKGKRRGGKREVYDAEVANEQRDAEKAAEAKPNWGLFEPVRPILEPLKPFASSQVVIAVLITLLAYSWLFPGRGGGSGVGFSSRPERVAAYEELWRREESELWDWLEDRVGLDGVAVPNLGGTQKALHSKDMAKKLKNERMKDREVDEAIRVTEERLGVLKEAVAGKRKG